MTIAYFFYFPEWMRELWPTFLSLASEQTLYVVSIVTVNVGVLVLANLMMLWIYKRKLRFFENYRISNKPWPWEENPEKWAATLKTTLKAIAFNIFVLQASFLYLDTLSHFHIKFDVESFPSVFTHIWQIFLFMIVEDFVFFLAHAALHLKQLYWIHKKHHEYNVTISLAA
jgi:sterol desaturase/sphingolipid hydroxylase (fatty acid hydroxylase superfamily)